MSLVQFEKLSFPLKGKVVVLTGGASGIGEALVHEAIKMGAEVVFGDINAELGERVAVASGATFVKCNVIKYQDLLGLFKEALQKHGRVDHAVSNAAVYEPRGIYDPSLTVETVENEPSTMTIDINVTGSIFFSHVASVFLREGAATGENKSLTFISSAAGVVSAPDTPIYTSTKAGILGLERALAQTLPVTHGIRVNAVCPSVTDTPLAALHVLPFFQQAGLPVNTATEVAEAITGLAYSPGMNGKILYVEAGKYWDIEEGLLRTMPEWIGEGPMSTLVAIKRILGEQDQATKK